ncbi:MAG: hypothetical protein IIV08_07110, partial [Selenomonadales bacterium]|nr:hypothetical protein [Selenomonadales bacterium]
EMKPQQRPQARPEMKPQQRPQARPEMKPQQRPQARPEMKPQQRPAQRPDMRPNGNQPPRGNGFDKDRPNGRPDMRPNGNQPPKGNGFDKDRPNGRPDMRPDHRPPHGNDGMRPDHRPPHGNDGMRPDHRPPHGDGIRPPHDRRPHYRPPVHRSHYHPPHHHHYHGRYHLYYGIFIPPIIYGGCYYDTIYDNDAIIEKFVYIQPSKHTNIFLTPLLRDHGHPDDAVFCVTYDGYEAYQYDLKHGDGSFYRIAIDQEPKARKWKADPPTSPNPPYITSLDDFLYKYHFTPSPTALFDGKHLYKFDADNRTFVENQTIEGLTTTYKHGDIYLIHATPESTHPYPKYYLILPDAIYETTADMSVGYIDFNELNHDTKKLWKIIK